MFQLRIIVLVCLNFLSSALNLCPESISTVSIVSHCPNSASEWTSAAIRKSCEDMGKVQTCTKSDNFAYHCVLNKEATMLIEVCAPVHFMNGYCARFSEVDKRILNDPGLDCTKFNPPCPPRFPSNESYKYQTCYKIAGEHLEVNPKFDPQKKRINSNPFNCFLGNFWVLIDNFADDRFSGIQVWLDTFKLSTKTQRRIKRIGQRTLRRGK